MQGPLELADVCLHVGGDELEDGLGDVDFGALGLHPQDGEAGLEIGRLDVGDQAHHEAAAETVLEGGDGVGRPVGGQHDLAIGLVEGVEGVEELLLEPFFALEEVDVVDEQHVDLAVAPLELGGGVVPDGVDVLVEEQLGAHVADHEGRVVLFDVVADGVQEVGLAQPAGPVDGQRVVGAGRRLGHAEGGGVGELVGAADDEGLEGLLGPEVGRPGRDGERVVDALRGHGQLVEEGQFVEGVGVLVVEPGGVGQVEEVGRGYMVRAACMTALSPLARVLWHQLVLLATRVLEWVVRGGV